MLQKLREKSSGWIATAIILLLCVPFAFFGMDQYLFQRNATFVARVEAPPSWWQSAPSWWPVSILWQTEEIEADEFRTVLEQQRQQRSQIEGDTFDTRAFEAMDSKRQILDGVVDRRIMGMLAEREGLVVGNTQLRETIESVPAFQVGDRFDPQSYQLALASQNQTPRQFEDVLRRDLQQSLVPLGISNSAFATRSEVDRLLKLTGESRDVAYLALPAPAPDTAPVSAAEIERWYQQHSERYRAPESVTLEVVDVDGTALPPPPAPSEQALRERYVQEQARFGTGEQRLAAHILVKGSDEAAKKKAASKKK